MPRRSSCLHAPPDILAKLHGMYPKDADRDRRTFKILLSAFHNFVQRNSNLMRRGDPVNLKEQGSDRKGNVGKHEQWEREEIRDDAPLLFAMNMTVLNDRREQTHYKKRSIHVEKRHENRTEAHTEFAIGGQETM